MAPIFKIVRRSTRERWLSWPWRPWRMTERVRDYAAEEAARLAAVRPYRDRYAAPARAGNQASVSTTASRTDSSSSDSPSWPSSSGHVWEAPAARATGAAFSLGAGGDYAGGGASGSWDSGSAGASSSESSSSSSSSGGDQ